MAVDDKKSGESFLSRWSRRKIEVAKTGDAAAANAVSDLAPEKSAATEIEKPNPSIGAASGAKVPGEALPERTLPSGSSSASGEAASLPPLESLTRESDFAPFMRADVAPALRNQAMKKLFSDPHYNVMDRLDIYIDDYGKSDPIPPAMLRLMNQSKTLGLFEEEERAEEEARRVAEEARRAAAGEPTLAQVEAVATARAEEDARIAATATTAVTEASANAAGATDAAPAADDSTFPFAPQSPS